MVVVCAAYECLSHPAKRRIFDENGVEGLRLGGCLPAGFIVPQTHPQGVRPDHTPWSPMPSVSICPPHLPAGSWNQMPVPLVSTCPPPMPVGSLHTMPQIGIALVPVLLCPYPPLLPIGQYPRPFTAGPCLPLPPCAYPPSIVDPSPPSSGQQGKCFVRRLIACSYPLSSTPSVTHFLTLVTTIAYLFFVRELSVAWMFA